MRAPFFFMEDINFNSYDNIINDALFEANDASANHGGSIMDTFLGQLLLPGRQQKIEFGQQVAMQKYMNAYNDPSAQMARMKAAGINPNIAAAGIAGGNASPSVSGSSSSAVGSGSQAAQGLAAAADAVTGGASSLADAAFKNGTLVPTIDKLTSDAKRSLSAAGLDDANAEAVITDNYYRDDNWRSELAIKRQRFSNMKQQYDNLVQTHEQIIADIQAKIARAKADNNLADLEEAQKLQIEEMTHWNTAVHEFCKNNKLFITESGIDGYIFSLIQSGSDLSLFNKFVEVYSKYRGSIQKALSDAEQSSIEDHAFGISNARRNGENASDEYYGRVGSWADAIGRAGKLLLGGYKDIPSYVLDGKAKDAKDVRSAISKMIADLSSQLSDDENNNIRLNNCIYQLQQAMFLTDKELMQWYSKNKFN